MATLDDQFYQPADDFFPAHAGVALTYDDVTLATLYSEILPRDDEPRHARSHERLHLRIPIISADMDTVTESPHGHRHGARRRARPHPLQHARAAAALAKSAA